MGKTSSIVKDRYNKKVYEIKIRVPKGKKQQIQSHAVVSDGSLNKFINRAIDDAMERDNLEPEDIATPDEVKAINEAQEEFKKGEYVSHEDINWDSFSNPLNTCKIIRE